MNELRRNHPSNRLYRNDVTDFPDAVRMVRGQCHLEQSALTGDAKIDGSLNASLEGFAASASAALVIYEKHVGAARKAAVAEMKASSDEDVRRFGQCLESGDYSPLAI